MCLCFIAEANVIKKIIFLDNRNLQQRHKTFTKNKEAFSKFYVREGQYGVSYILKTYTC
jgi:hypothetical protein